MTTTPTTTTTTTPTPTTPTTTTTPTPTTTTTPTPTTTPTTSTPTTTTPTTTITRFSGRRRQRPPRAKLASPDPLSAFIRAAVAGSDDDLDGNADTQWHTITPNQTAVDLDETEDPPQDHDGWSATRASAYLAAHRHGADRPFEAGCATFPPVVIPEPSGFAFVRQRRLRREETAALRPIIDELLATKVIRERAALDGFCCPVHAVKKQGSDAGGQPPKFRLVTDLRLLNKQISALVYEGEKLADTARRIAGLPTQPNTRFARLDVKQFFFNFAVAEDSQHLFSFEFDGRYYSFTALSMGFKNSSALTNRFMAQMFSDADCRRLKLGIYADDLVVAGRDSDELLANLNVVLERLADAGLVLNGAKSVIDATSVVFAGVYVTPGAIGIAPEHLAAVRDWVPCTTRSALSRFVGLVRWVGTFCPSFATLVAPLEERLRTAKSTIAFTEIERAAFNAVKEALTDGEFLATFDESLPLLIYSDSSAVASGSVLMQQDVFGVWRVLAYVSKRFNAAQRNYSVRQRELFGFIVCAEKFADWFAAAPEVQCFTDHQSLEHVMTATRQESDRVARWCNDLSRYNVTFKYISGAQNGMADAISRRDLDHHKRAAAPARAPTNDPAPVAAHRVTAFNPPTAYGDALPLCPLQSTWLPVLLQEYAADPYFEGVLGPADSPSTASRHRPRYLVLGPDGCVWNTSLLAQPRLALPVGSTRDRIVQGVHESGGHQYHVGTTAQLKAAYFFEGMANYVERALATCTVCATAKHKTTATGFSNNHSAPQRRLGSLVMDVFSGLTEVAGYKQVLLIRDELTKYTVLAPLSGSAGAAEVITALETTWFSVFGYPSSIWCDKASYFTAERFTGFCASNNIALSFATTDHHVAPAERAIRVAREMMRTLLGPSGNWINILPMVALAMNRLVSRSDGLSASQRLFGFDVALPLLPSSFKACVSAYAGRETSAATLVDLIDKFYVVKEKSAAQHDKGRVGSGIKVGDQVFVPRDLVKALDSSYGDSKAIKMRSPFFGPFFVTEDEGFGNWRLSGLGDLRVQPVFHESVLKLRRRFSSPAVGQPWLRHGDMHWPDGSRRVQRVVQKRVWNGAVQYLVQFVGGAESDPGFWISSSQINSVDQQKISEFNSSSVVLQLPSAV